MHYFRLLCLFFSLKTKQCSIFFLGASLINYRQYPWSIGGLLAHELAHTLSVVHPFELVYLCQSYPALAFCQPSNSIPASCTCDSDAFPPEQCLMTFQFGRAATNAPTYTTCDFQMMNYFSSDISCLIKVKIDQINIIRFDFFYLF